MFKINLALACLIVSGSVLANPVIGVSAGPTWSTGNDKQTFYLQSDIEKTYTADNSNHIFPTLEIFVGWQSPFALMHQSLIGQLGISIGGAGHANLSGDIWEDADPEFDNYNYAYKVNHYHAVLLGRVIGNCNRFVEPYLSVGVGIGYNHAYDFTITPKISEEVAAPAFESNNTTAFVYTIGIGFQKAFTPQLQAAIGYEFADWGKTQLARAPQQTLNHGLTVNHLYANQLQISLFYTV